MAAGADPGRARPHQGSRGLTLTRAMILAAGFGTRMGALTKDRPKPLIDVAGRALIHHALDRCEEGGVGTVVVNLHYRGDQIRAALRDRASPKIIFSEETEILETGGGVAKALPLLGADPFFTLNADAIWTGAAPLAALARGWRGGAGALLLLAPRERALGHVGPGDFRLDAAGRITRRGAAETAPYVFTGAQIIAPDEFKDAPAGAFSTNLIWDRLIGEGRAFGLVHDGDWVDVGHPEGLRRAEDALR